MPFSIPKPLLYALGALLVLGAFYLMLDAYGDSRYQAGSDNADARWEEAGRRLEQQAAQSRTKADDAAVVRGEAYMERVEVEKERIDEAVATGGSPLDVLFGADSGGVRAGANPDRNPNPR